MGITWATTHIRLRLPLSLQCSKPKLSSKTSAGHKTCQHRELLFGLPYLTHVTEILKPGNSIFQSTSFLFKKKKKKSHCKKRRVRLTHLKPRIMSNVVIFWSLIPWCESPQYLHIKQGYPASRLLVFSEDSEKPLLCPSSLLMCTTSGYNFAKPEETLVMRRHKNKYKYSKSIVIHPVWNPREEQLLHEWADKKLDKLISQSIIHWVSTGQDMLCDNCAKTCEIGN